MTEPGKIKLMIISSLSGLCQGQKKSYITSLAPGLRSSSYWLCLCGRYLSGKKGKNY